MIKKLVVLLTVVTSQLSNAEYSYIGNVNTAGDVKINIKFQTQVDSRLDITDIYKNYIMNVEFQKRIDANVHSVEERGTQNIPWEQSLFSNSYEILVTGKKVGIKKTMHLKCKIKNENRIIETGCNVVPNAILSQSSSNSKCEILDSLLTCQFSAMAKVASPILKNTLAAELFNTAINNSYAIYYALKNDINQLTPSQLKMDPFHQSSISSLKSKVTEGLKIDNKLILSGESLK